MSDSAPKAYELPIRAHFRAFFREMTGADKEKKEVRTGSAGDKESHR